MTISDNEMQDQFESKAAFGWSEFAIFFAGCWITIAFLSSSLLRVHWLTPGDFKFSTAMYYHAMMVPSLVLVYLLTKKILRLKILNTRFYAVIAMISILFVGIGSILNIHEGFTAATAIQIIGMIMADMLGIALLVALITLVMREYDSVRKINAAFWLLFASIFAILLAAPLGHLAGWSLDFGTASFPGVGTLLSATGINPDEFQEGLIASHSHLIAVALLFALSAIAAIFLQHPSQVAWKKRMSSAGLWMAMISLLLATAIYLLGAIVGWEPPDLFTSGPNGMPFDDFVLTIGEIGLLILMVGLSGSPAGDETDSFSPIKAKIRTAIFLNWISGFIGAVVLGIYIEFNENFYGAGSPPAPGALQDNIFIRAHLLYPFLILPIIFTFLLVLGYKYHQTNVSRPLLHVFIWTSIVAIALGLIGEFLWFFALQESAFLAGMIITGIALVIGTISLFPGKKLIDLIPIR